MGLARVWTGYQRGIKIDPEFTAATLDRLREYDADLKVLSIEDDELERPPPLITWWRSVLLVFQLISVFVLLPPFLLIGCIVNLPPAGLLVLVAKAAAKKEKDIATIKILGGVLLFPLVWGLWGWLAAWGVLNVQSFYSHFPQNPVLAGGALVLLSVLGGLLMLGYIEAAGATLRALRVRLTRTLQSSALERLLAERAELYDALLKPAVGDLPGVVEEDGSIGRR